MNFKTFFLIAGCVVLCACGSSTKESFSIENGLKDVTQIVGKNQNGDYPYVTAGDKLYSIGNQAGEFPNIGFHVPGEMGGVWQHPIKLVDGYRLSINDLTSNFTQSFDKCSQFVAYPFASQFHYNKPEQKLAVVRTDFVPDQLPVLVVEYRISNQSGSDRQIEVVLDLDTDLSPVWLGERINMINSPDNLYENKVDNIFLAKDSLNNWFAGITSDMDSLKLDIIEKTKQTNGNELRMKLKTQPIAFVAGETKTIRFYIGGSINTADEVNENLIYAKENIETLFNNKKQRYNQIDNTASINIPDTLLMQAYQWGKYNTDWLIRDVPEMGRGLNAGLPDYPWFFSNDQASAFSALFGTVDPQLFKDSWEMLLRISNKTNNDSGRIIHEVSTNGVVYDEGRMEESQEFIVTALEIFKWSGDKEFLKIYYEHGKKVWEFLKQHDKNNNLFIEGYGGVEIEGLDDEMLDVAVGTQIYFSAMAEMATIFEEEEIAKDFSEKAGMLKQKIEEDWWVESENRYADFISSKSKAIQLIDRVLKDRVTEDRNNWAKVKLNKLKQDIQTGQYKDKGYVVFYNPSTLGPLEAGISSTERAQAVLKGLEYFTNKYGLYIVGVARPDDITLEEGSVAHRLKGDFNYHEAIMTIATSNLAIMDAKYNGIESADKYIQKILNNFSFATPGTTYEVNPDYGMFAQAWNVKGLNVPLIRYMFGVNPNAYIREISIEPDMPSSWNYGTLKDLLVGNNKLTIDFKREGNKQVYKINSSEDGWTINFSCAKSGGKMKLNGKDVASNENIISVTGNENTIEVLN